MRHLYSALLYLLLPLALLRLLWRSRLAPAYRERWSERLGFFAEAGKASAMRADVWIHAVSVGEVQAAQPLIRHLLGREPALSVIVTTTTPTGARRLQELFGTRVHHCYTPFDLPPIMRRFLHAVRPRLVLVLETEIWPNMLFACARQQIPVILANARLSARSARGYARVRDFAAQTMRCFALIAAQSEEDAARFARLGVPREQLQVTGSIKFDVQVPASLMDRAEVMRRNWGMNRAVWVAASTHEGEEEILLDAHQLVRAHHPDALLVLVPRHPERFDRVAALVQRQGFVLARRSHDDPCGDQVAVYLGDTMGELTVFLAAADAAFIGGSLVPVGGHNLLEAAAVGVPAVTGPHTFNFTAITELLLRAGAAARVADAAELAQCITAWLGDAAERARVGENGLRVVEQNRGALASLLAVIDERINAFEAGPPIDERAQGTPTDA